MENIKVLSNLGIIFSTFSKNKTKNLHSSKYIQVLGVNSRFIRSSLNDLEQRETKFMRANKSPKSTKDTQR